MAAAATSSRSPRPHAGGSNRSAAAAHDTQTPPLVLRGFEVSPERELKFGRHVVPLDQVAEYAPVHEKARDLDSTLATMAVFLGAAAFFMVLVFEIGWRERFLVAALLFAVIAAAAIIDLLRSSQIHLYRLAITLADGETVELVTADREMLMGVLHVLDQARKGQ
jgi:Family of unknown function (DUF6232)